MYDIGAQLINGIKEHALKYNIPILIQGDGPMFKLSFIDDLEKPKKSNSIYKKFYSLMIQNGVRIEYGDYLGSIWFISTEHNLEDIKITLNSIDKVFEKISNN